ncbi:family 15 glycosyltransferase [Mariannaea sp. PMI_226]|nr:family 15 glycosyltransferase [Mariannaea sp. PMI_226]
MDLIRRAAKVAPKRPHTPLPIDERRGFRPKSNADSRWAFFRRPLRLRGNSTISVPLGIVIFFPMLVLILIFILFVSHPSSAARFLIPGGAPPSTRKISEKYDKVFVEGCVEPDTSKPRANAAFVILARNSDLDGVIQSVRSVERHFNRWFHYPYVFLNDNRFDSNFKNTVKKYVSGDVEFGKVESEMWDFPDWIDPKIAHEGIAKQGDAAVMYGGLESYHKMCRFYSGFFFNHPLLLKYEWYWRVEPDIKYFCDITYDPFLKMIESNKTYGFTIAVKELRETVPNIFRYASAYKRLNNLTSQGLWEMFVEPPDDEDEADGNDSHHNDFAGFMPRTSPNKAYKPLIDPQAMEGEKYNMCHFWSNFEIAKLSWFRSKEYRDFFEIMERGGGFWMERWGDAPIHSLAAGALLGPQDIHYFRDFGYRHTTIQHCPSNAPGLQLPREPYLEETINNEAQRFEEDNYWEHWDTPKDMGIGCRCRCDTDVVDVEGKEGSCLAEWVDVAGGWAE